MSTEYTYYFGGTSCCLGVSAIGWSFRFQGFRHTLINPDYPQHGFHEESPFGYPIVSRQDWIHALTENPGTLVDEYGTDHPNYLEWINNMSLPDLAKERAMEYQPADPVLRQLYIDRETRFCWRDPEGFQFCGEDMST